LGAGAAAGVGLLWFIATADWLPPGWTEFWKTHSISAGFVTTILGAVAGWIFLDERLAMRRLAAVHATWSQWLDGQSGFLTAITEDPPSPDEAVTAQRARAADLHARLLVQQQWLATMFTVAALRTDDGGTELIPVLGKLRDIGTDAIRDISRLQTLLDSLAFDYIPAESIDALWGAPLSQLGRLAEKLQDLRVPLRAGHWEARAKAGFAPTHPVSDVDSLPVRVTSWSR
jgi:hypothetical protein